MRHKYLTAFLMLTVVLSAMASDSIGWSHSLGVDVRPSFAFSSYKDDILSNMVDMENAKKTTVATSVHLQYGFSFPSDSHQGRICPEAWQGIGTAVNFLGNPQGLGTPISVYAFQGAPLWHFSDRLSLYYEWNFGASFGWHPCDGVISRSNLIVGSTTNAYINIGTGITYRMNDSYSLTAGVDLTHYSNGNTSYPNPGVNMAGVRIGIIRFMGSARDKNRAPELQRGVDESQSDKKFRRPELDITIYGALRKRVYRGGDDPVLLNGRFAVAGLDISPMWRLSRNFRLGPSADLQWDESTDLKRNHFSGTTSDDILFTRPSFFRQVCAGLSARGELVMPVFSLNLGIGYNIIGPEETRASYELANLKVRLTDSFFLNIGYQLLNFRKQNNLMLGIGYTFR